MQQPSHLAPGDVYVSGKAYKEFLMVRYLGLDMNDGYETEPLLGKTNHQHMSRV